MTDAHEAIGQYVEEEAADKFVGVEGDDLFSIPIFAISVAQGDLAVVDSEDAVVGQSHAAGVAAEVIEDGLWRAERLFRVDDPVFLRDGLISLFAPSIFPRCWACCNRLQNFPRKTRLKALTGNRKFCRALIQRL